MRKKKNTNQETFAEMRFFDENVKLYNAMRKTHPSLYTKMLKAMRDGDPIKTFEENGLVKVRLEAGELFERVFGPIIFSFNSNELKLHTLVDVQPKEYFNLCYRYGSYQYKGVVIPKTPKSAFKVDLSIAMNK